MMKLVLSIITVVLLEAGITQATVDCNVPPNFRALKNCCRLPEPNMQEFAECNKYDLKQPGAFSCISSCIFNSTGAIENDRLNLPNLRSALIRLLKGDTTYLDETVMPAFEECDAEIQKQKATNNFDTNTKPWNGRFEGQCSKVSQSYLICASKKIFMNCPSNIWSSTVECETGKEYLTNCKPDFNGRGKFVRPMGGGRRDNNPGTQLF